MGDLESKIGRVTGTEYKHSKLVNPETKTWPQGGHNKEVVTEAFQTKVVSWL